MMRTFRELAESVGLTAEELGRLLDVPNSQVTKYLAGALQPSVREIQVIRGIALTVKGRKQPNELGSGIIAQAQASTAADNVASVCPGGHHRGMTTIRLERERAFL